MASLRKRKRAIQRRKEDDDHCDDATTRRNMIDDLPESLLLLEIFSKLRNPRDVLVCKSVSKRWNFVISSSFHYNPSLALILNTDPQCAIIDLCLEGWKGFELSNYLAPKFKAPVCVLASYKDVLLCIKYSYSGSQYYIVNPVTMQWTRLPETGGTETTRFPIGLSGNGSKGRYYVVKLVDSTPSMLKLRVFDSKGREWREDNIEHPPWSEFGWCPTQHQALSFKGALHWLAQDGPIVAYNPKHTHKCKVIHRSQEMRHASCGDLAVVSETLTVSMGRLRIIHLVCYPHPCDHHHLSIWTLVDYKQSKWKEEHEPIYFRDMVSSLPWIQDYMRGYNLEITNQHNMSFHMSNYMFLYRNERSPPQTRQPIICPYPLVCHQTNPLVVYMYLPESIVSLDLTTKELRLITRVRQRGRYWDQYDKVIPITLRLDPSFVPDHGRVLAVATS